MRVSGLALITISLLVLALEPWGRVSAQGCSIRITSTSPSSLPRATKPGEKIVKFWFDLTTSDPQATELEVEASGRNMDVLSRSISASTHSGSVRFYVHTDPGAKVDLTITVSCRVGDERDSDSKYMGSSYIVYVPNSWTPSISPRTVEKRSELVLEASGLDEVDDGVGDLTVTAKLGSKTYRLSRVSRGVYRSRIGVNLVNTPSGSRTVAFTVTKSYAGVSDISRKSSSFTVVGDPPSVSFNPPSEVHRGDTLTVTVTEPDGDSVNGSLSAFGRAFRLEKGENIIEVPRDIDSGSYRVDATVEDVDGSSSGSWTLEVSNLPPKVHLSLDRDLAVPGDVVTASVSVEDDSTGLSAKLLISGNGVHETHDLDEDGGEIRFRVPQGYSGELTFTVSVVDRDGASASARESLVVGIPPSIEGDLPRVVHRGEDYRIEVRGDKVHGRIDYMGRAVEVNGPGIYTIPIPREVRAGDYQVTARVSSPFGDASKSWRIVLENIPPRVRVTVTPNEAPPGERVTLRVECSDDSPGAKVTLRVRSEVIRLVDTCPEKEIRLEVPPVNGPLRVEAEIVDADGASARDSTTLMVRNIGEGGPDGETSNGSAGAGEAVQPGEGYLNETDGRNASLTARNGTAEDESAGPSSIPDSSFNSSGSSQEGGFSLVILPADPEIGDNVSVIVTPGRGCRGSVWVVNPDGSVIVDRPISNRRVIELRVDEAGPWSVRWAYRCGNGTKFGQTEFNVSNPRVKVRHYNEPVMEERIERNEGEARASIAPRGMIRTFIPSCRVIGNRKESESGGPDALIAITAVSLIALLVIRRRFS